MIARFARESEREDIADFSAVTKGKRKRRKKGK